MANTARMAILRAKIEGAVTDLMLKTTAEHVFVNDTTTLAAHLATLAEKATLEQLQQTVENLGALGQKDKIAFADLEEALQTLINNKAEASALTEEIARAKAAEEAAQAAADAVAGRMTTAEGQITTMVGSDTGKSIRTVANEEAVAAANTEKSRAEGIEAGLRTDIDTVKADYLKAADKTELSNAIAAEKERAEAAEAGLQTQINTIMDNPDTEGVINSINEFTQYVADHGEIAEGFRTSIAANTKAIEDHAALAAETYMSKEDAAAELEELANQITAKAVQADWNQNDSTAADFVKNRPFYADLSSANYLVRDLVINSSTATYVEGCYEVSVPEMSGIDIGDGDHYLLFNGRIYKHGFVDDDAVGFGEIPHPTDPTRLINFYLSEDGLQIGSSEYLNENESFIVDGTTVSIVYGDVTLKQINDSFIPDTIARRMEVYRSHEYLNNFILTVAEDLNNSLDTVNGKITALEETAAGLGDMAQKDVVSESDLDADLAAKVNASAEANHSHANKELLDSYTQTEADLADAVAKKHEHLNKDVIDTITAAMLSSWMGKAKVYGADEVVDLPNNEIYIQLV